MHDTSGSYILTATDAELDQSLPTIVIELIVVQHPELSLELEDYRILQIN